MKSFAQQVLENIPADSFQPSSADKRSFRKMRRFALHLMSTVFLLAGLAVLPEPASGQCSLPTALAGCDGTCPTPYPEVDNVITPNGRDDNYNVLIGGNLTVNDAAEMEGKVYIGGNLVMNRFSGYNMGYVGLGTGVLPSNNIDWVTVVGDVNVPNFPAGYILGPDAAPDFLGNFVYGGFLSPFDLNGVFPDVVNFASESNTPTNTAPFDEMFSQLAAISDCLGAKSQSPASDITFVDNGGGAYTITEVSEANVYIVSLSSGLSAATLNFVGFEGDETIVFNVDLPGSGDVVTIDIAATQRNGSPAGEGASSGTLAFSLREGILWNFPDASSVTISGGQLQGSVLVPGATATTTVSAAGLNGRFWVEGNAVHSGSGSEFHAFPFRGNLPLTCCDYGDLPDLTSSTGAGDYQTLLANDGPRHLVNNALRIGASVDGEGDGQQSAIADGDDANTDDEDGIASFPTFYAGQSANITVSVTNTTGNQATLYGWIDFNNDGQLDNSTERASVTVLSGGASNVTLAFNVPGGAVTSTSLGARFRLSTDPDAANSTGSAGDGEVEDYVVQIQPPLVCGISISDVQVSGCTYNIAAGESQATVTVEVSWVNPPAGENIFVTIGAQTKFIDLLGGAASPATVTFNVLADGSLGNVINAAFSGNTCAGSSAYDAPVACPPAGCLLNIVEVGVGECVNNATTGNVPTALVSVQVDWINQPPGSLIEITFDGQSKTINPNSNGNPKYVQFLANLNTAAPSGMVTAQFSPGACNVATASYLLPAPCAPTTPCAGPNAIGGNVFSDFDSDGKKDASEFGLEGIVVDVFDCNGNLMCTTTTDFNGDWTCTGLANGEAVRVEFYNYPYPYVAAAADDNNQSGRTNDGGSVQFAIVGSDCQVDFGLINIAEFCENNPFLILPCWVRGDPLVPGASAGMPVMVAVPYQASGNKQQVNVQHTYLATNAEVGPTWGVAYNRNTRTVFASALLRRHSGWGPDSLSAIYKIDVSQVPAPSITGNSSLYVDLDAQFGIDAADEYTITRDLSPNLTVPSFDPQAFDLVGKAGFGDIDISADFDSIFVVNLFTRSLVIIQNDPNTDTPLSATEIAIPDPNCMGGSNDWRPWALKYHKGVLYVGGVCSGQTNQNDQQMIGVVYSFDPITSSFAELISFDLDYPKGSPASWLGNPSADCKNWNPWTANFSDIIESGIELCYPQPILTDIEFDVFGNMTLGFVDRMGLQGGWYDYDTSPPTSQAYKSNLGGDVLRVFNNNGHYLLEKDAVAGYTTGCGSTQPAPGQGPGGGEFYCQDAFGSAHEETAQGGLALHPSNNEIVTAVMDPLGAFSAGLAWYNNGTGVSTRQYEVYYSGNSGTTGLFGKAAGLGDLELTCSEPFQQIGNFVFIDENINGAQDACDTPVAGIEVSLYSISGTLIATTTTDADGYYYFNTADGITPETDYYIVFGTDGEWSGTTLNYLGDAYSLTLINIGAGPRPDLNDSDASIAGGSLPPAIQGFPYILASTPIEGTSDHSFDAGFILPSFSVGSTVFLDINEDGIQNSGEPGLPNIAVELYQAGDVPGVGLPLATDMTDGNGDYFFGNLLAGDYFVYVPAPPGIAPESSAGAGIADSDTDANDDGAQSIFGGPSQSGVFTLSFSDEPVDGAGETGQGNLQDNFDDANGNMTIDFGFIPAVSVGSTVFYDENNNGIQDGGEPGIDGVTVQLFSVGPDGQPNTMDDVLIDTDMTTGGGNYFFFGLRQGNYYLVIPTPPADYALSSTTDELDPDSDLDQNDNGLQPGGAGAPVQSGVITLTVNGEPVNGAGENGPGSGEDDFDDNNGNSTVDFGFIPAVSVGSLVFADLDNNGLYDGSDFGIDGVEVELWSTGADASKGTADDIYVATDLTSGGGVYFFGNLPQGEYYLKIQTTQFGSGQALEAYSLSSTDIASSGSDNLTDNDDNGLQMGGAGTMVMSPEFLLEPNTETTAEPGPGGAQDDSDDDNGDMTKDFGFSPVVSIGSTVFADVDNDGQFEPQDGEDGIPGVVVEVWSTGLDGDKGTADDVLAGSDITDSNGDYFLGGLFPGEYYVLIPASEFGAGEPLQGQPWSSSPTDTNDNGEDNDDNGIQMGGQGTMVMSPEIILTPNAEPVAPAEGGSGSTQDDFADANGDMTVDFGFVPSVSVGSLVWADADNDGQYEPSESGIDGVEVQLWSPGPDGAKGGGDDIQIVTGADGILGTADDPAAAPVVTAGGGLYYFGNLLPGSYYVVIPTPDAAFPLSSTPTDANANNQEDNDDNGIQDGGFGSMAMSSVFMLQAGAEPAGESGPGGAQDDADDDNGDMTIDFGFIPAMSVGSHVFADLDNNGLFDGADFGIDGVEVELWSTGPDGDKGTADDALIATDVTAGGGLYFFDGLQEGEYYLKIQNTQFGAGEALEAYPLSSADIASTGTDNPTDNDDNGLQMGGAGGMVMSPEFILEANAEPASEPGPGGAQDDSDDDNGDMTKDFGFTPAVSIGSTAFADIDNDGLYEPQDGENGIPGVVVQVWSTGPDGDKGTADDVQVGSDITDSNGDYYVGGLYEGEYYVVIPASEFGAGEPLQGQPWSSTPTDTNDNGEDDDDNGIQMGGLGTMVMSPEIILAPGTEPLAPAEDGSGSTQDDAADANGDMTVDFGFVPAVSVGSLVFADEDNNGLYDGSDSGIDGVEVQLWSPGPDGTKGGGDDVQIITGADGLLGTADDIAAAPVVTAGGGLYYFGNLLPGNYYVVIPTPDAAYPLSSTPTDTDANNGEDDDDNGIQDGGLGAMAMSSVFELAVAAEPMGESGPGGAQDDADDDNGDMAIDFGFIPAVSVGSHVFADLDNNGLFDGADFGIDGVEVELWSTGSDGDKGTADDALVASDLTAGGGLYFFDRLLEGEYYLKIQSTQFGAGEALEAYLLSSADITSSDTDNPTDNDDNGLQMGGAGGMVMSPEFILESNTEPASEPGPGGAQDDPDDDNGDMTKDFGFTPAVSVGSTVFLDEDNDGIQDLNEQGIPGVVLELYDAGPDKLIGTADDGGLVASTTTNSVGDYYFGGLYEGNYYIQIPASQFGAGMSLENATLSSVNTDTNDNQEDFDDNGSQTVQGTTTTSPVFMLMAGTEPVGGGEDAQGGTQDDASDANGDMTIDFGFVPIYFDLALIKELGAGQSNMVEPGDEVDYAITVFNQGNVAADNITVTDYVPAGMTFNPALNPAWSLNGNGGPQTTITIPGGLQPGASTTVNITLTVNAPLSSGTMLVNVAEISNATDFQGFPQDDVDSTPDDVDNNDTYLNDNEVNGDGTNGGDEDDQDPAEVVVEPFDLALVKLLGPNQANMVEPGDDVTYVIEIINQGMIPADNIVVTDYLPAGMSFNPGLNPGWSINGNGDPQTTININGGLLPGASTTVSLILTVNDPLPAGTSLVNLAEISGATDEDGNPVEDFDSTPDEVDDNDTFLQDNDVSGDGNDGEDEDDSDPAEVIVEPFDLALTKALGSGQSAMVEPGDIVTFTIRVYNQGMIPADNIVVTDYVPAGMAFNPAFNFGWALNGNGDPAITLSDANNRLPAGGLAPGASVSVNIILTVDDPLPAGARLVNVAEISGATDENGNAVQDVDSTPDDVDDNDNYLVDNEVNGNANTGGDEDDHDPAEVIVEPFDLALTKVLANGQSAMVEPGDNVTFTIRVINQGMIPADNIVVTDYVPAGMSFNPALNPGWSLNGNGDPSRTITVPGGLQPGASRTVNITLTVDDPLPAGAKLVNFAEISDATDEDGNAVQDIDSTPDDVDGNDTYLADNYVSGDANEGEDEDDHDPAEVIVEPFDLALVKELAAGQAAMVEPGDEVSFTINVINQGMIPADNIVITDYVPAGMAFNPALNPGWSLNGNGDPATTITIAGGLLPGASTSVNIVLTVDDPLMAGLTLVNFAEISGATDEDGNAVLDVDSTPDDVDNNDTYLSDNDTSGNGNEGEDEDDHDPAQVTVEAFDLALVKKLAAGQPYLVEPGDNITYTIEVINQGMIPADNIEITDYVPAGMTFNPALNPAWGTNGNGDPFTVLSIVGGLLPGQSITVNLVLTVNAPLPSGANLVNFAEISGATDEDGNAVQDIDSTPDDVDDNDTYLVDNDVSGNGNEGEDEDDHDQATVIVEPFDLALVKVLSAGQSATVEPGDDVSFTIRVINQGMIPADNIVVTDYVPTGMSFNPALNPAWSLNGNGDPQTTIIVAGGLQPGTSTTVDIILSVDDPLSAGLMLVNFAEISGATDEDGNPVQDVDSTPDDVDGNDTYLVDNSVSGNANEGDDEDDHDPATVIVEAFDLALVKQLAPNQPAMVEPGEDVTFAITVINQGMIPADNIVVTDYVPTGMSFNPALNPAWSLNANGDPATTLTIAGGLQPGASITVNITLTVDDPLAAGTSLLNFAEITDATDEDGNAVEDIDSTPDDVDGNDTFLSDNDVSGNGNEGEDEDDHDVAEVIVEPFDLALFKELGAGQPATVEPGDTVLFTITVVNQGMIPADNIEVVDYVPAGMSFDATLNAGWALNGNGDPATVINIAGGLQPGASTTVDIYLVVDAPLAAGTSLVNFAEVASATDEDGNAVQDIDSTPDDTDDNDTYLQDNDIDGDGLNGGDEDDHDPATVTVEAFDLALYKVLGNGEDATVEPGDTVIFTITVVNQGAIIANNITVTDYMPAGMSFDPSLNPGWVLNANGQPEFTMVLASGLLPGKSQSVDIALVIDAPLPAGTELVNFAEITSATDENGGPQQDVDSTPDDTDDNDLYLEDNYIDGNGLAGGDEDDHDPATVTVEVFDLALMKLLGDSQSATVQPGDTVHFTFRVINQGMIPADNIVLSDYVPAEMNFEAGISGNAGWTETAPGLVQRTISVANGGLPTGGLLPGDSVEVEIYLALNSPLPAGTQVDNYGEISSATDEYGDPQQDVDSDPDNNPDNDVLAQDNEVSGDGNDGEDEDDHDIATISTEAFDLALYKLLSDGQPMVVEPGDTVYFTVYVVNQGTIAADNIKVTDYVPAGMSFDGTLNPGWVVSLGKYQRTLSVANGGLPAGGLASGATIAIEIALTVDAPLAAGTSLVNFAEITSATDSNGDAQQDIDSAPDSNGNNDTVLQDNDIDGNGLAGGDEDDHDFAEVVTEAFDLALYKVLSDGQSMIVEPGDTVSYTIHVVNQGMIPADNISLTDYIPSGMFFDGPLNPGWTFVSGKAVRTLSVANSLLPSGGLAPGQTVSVNLQLVVASPLPQGTSLVNFAEITSATDENGDPVEDIDSAPDNNPGNDTYLDDNDIDGNGLAGGDEDDHDPAVVVTEAFDLALVKLLGDGQEPYVEPGDTVLFTIEVINQGMIAADGILVADYIPDGLNFNAALNPGWNATSYGAVTALSVAGGELPAGGLAPGASVTVDVYLIVDNPINPGVGLLNFAEIITATDENGAPQVDIDSDPDNNPNNDTYLQDNEVSGNGNEGEDEDDHDGALVTTEVFDLALTKRLKEGQNQIVFPSDTITFEVEVFNQGQVPADNISVVDYVPGGFLFDAALNPAWMVNAGGYPETTISVAEGELPAGGLQPGFSYIIEIRLIVDPGVEQGQDLLNFAEISGATDDEGNPEADIDSTPDDDPDNDTYANDNETTGNGMLGGDEDDHDPAFVDVACYKSPGEDTDISVCLGCAAAQVVVDFFGSLEGNPWPGGYWTDLDGSGLDLSDPTMVVVTGLEAGFYRFSYTIPGVNNCPSRSAILTLEVVSIENLVCNANVNISLGESCEAEVSVDNILEGDLPCYTDLEVHIINLQGNDIGNVVNSAHIGQTLFVKVVDPMCNNHCWGTIKVEDKKAPVIDCPENTDEATVAQEVHQIVGELMPADPTINLANHSCFIETAVPQAGPHYYDLIPFQVNVDDYYTFQMISSWGDGSAAIFAGSFDEAQPCQNMIAQQDDAFNGAGGVSLDPLFSITLPLEAGQVYYLFTSSWQASQTGDYTWNVYSASGDGWIGSWDTTYITNPVDWSVDTSITFNGLPTTTLNLSSDLICTDISHILNNPASLAYTGAATATDNCTDDVEITFSDAIFGPNGDCDETVILRTFTATDGSGNIDQCVQEIRVRKATLADVNLPPFTAVLECDESFTTLPNGNPSPEVTGYPSIRTAFGLHPLSDDFCNIGAIYEDQPRISVCEGAYKFVRHWVIVDWCAGGAALEFDQIIKVGDFTPPVVSGPAEDYDWDGEPDVLTYSTGPFSCAAAFEVPLPEVSDNCSGWEVLAEVLDTVLVDVYNQYGLLNGQVTDTIVLAVIPFDAPSRIVSGIPAGENLFRYTVEDECGNRVVRYVPFVVKDQIEPSAVCNEDLHVSIGGGDYARIYAEDINEGSTDNCGIASIDVRRNKFDADGFTCGDGWSEWADYVDFFCCDAGDTITIEMRVTDFDGNENICWLTVVPEEKVRPYCYAPHDVSVGCDLLPYGFEPDSINQLVELFGAATAEDNCGATIEELSPVVDLECGFGTITRRFRAIDLHGNVSNNFCQQVITIEEVHNYEIRFPADASAVCGEAEPDSVTVNEIGCDLLAISHTDEFFSASGDECYKIFRTWRVINWCQYDGQSDPYVIGRDEDCDNQPGDEAVWVLFRPNGYTYIDRDNDETEPNDVPLAFQNVCNGIDDFWRKAGYDGGYYEYLQIIKVYDDIDPEVVFEAQDAFCSYDNAECSGLVAYPFSIVENCTPADLTVKVFLDANDDGNLDGEITADALSGSFPDFTITGNFPIGSHRFEVHVEDGCGNASSVDIPFQVIDCKAPAPTCINGLATELMPFDTDNDGIFDEGRMTVWASDFIVSPMQDCSGPVTYSINRIGEPASVDSTAIVLTCADTGNLVVEVWAWDAAGNSDFCETYIQVQDNFGVCGNDTLLLAAGNIATEVNSMVEDVEVTLSGEGFDVMMTGANGWYGFSGLQEGYDYTVTPMRDGDYLNGVSTYDLVLMSKHILGVAPLNSPYKIIAADVNNSHTVTTLDMILLRKLILSIDTEFGNNTSWRFVARSYVFPVPSNPWFEDFPEVISINNLPASGLNDADFIALKVGDVTLDAVTNSLMVVEERDKAGVFYFQVEDQALKAGNEYAVAFKASGLARMEGYQATLSFDKNALELVDIMEGVAKSDNFGLRYLDEGLITTSWNASGSAGGAGSGTSDPEMFRLVFRAKADAMLSELLSVNSRITKAEAYRRGGEFQDVALSFGQVSPAGDGFELYQNWPNPFQDETVISFKLPQAEAVVVTISDVNGRMLKLIRMDGVKGYNELKLKRGSLPTGVLSYTVKAGEYTATRKMVCTE